MNSDRANPIPSRVPAARSHSYLRKIAALLLVLVISCLPVQSQQQQQRNPSAGPSELASENLSRVAASAAQIEEVLRKDPGLLVELKRWIAKEATGRGQIVEDADLTDRAIFDRLTRDQQFRVVATRLLQRYGYLLPKLNPDSEPSAGNLLGTTRTRQPGVLGPTPLRPYAKISGGVLSSWP